MKPTVTIGDTGSFNEIEWRVSKGRKPVRLVGATDMRLDIRTPGGEWRSVPMHLGFLMADAFFQIEEALYPQSQGFMGGNRFIQFCHRAVEHGFREVCDQLDREKAAA